MIDAGRLLRLADELVWLAGELRAAVPTEEMSGDLPHEMTETEIAPHLDLTADALRKKRERGEMEGLYRRSGRSIMYFTRLALAAMPVRSRDSDI